MDSLIFPATLFLIVVLGGLCTWLAWRATAPQSRWCVAAACFWGAVFAFGVAVLLPAQMDAQGYLHEPGLPFAAIGYLATAAGTLVTGWAAYGWRAARTAFTRPPSASR